MFKFSEKTVGIIVAAIMIIVLGAFTFGWAVEQPCHSIHKDSLYCHTHPWMWYDVVGVIGFYLSVIRMGLIVMASISRKKKGTYEEANSVKKSLITIGLIVLSVAFFLV